MLGAALRAGLLIPLALGGGASARPQTSPAGIVAVLDAERRENGIPANLTLDPSASAGCADHLRYEELNGISWTDTEVPGHAGYTKAGQVAAGASDEASTGGFDRGDPYDNLPVHLANLLDPGLTGVGAADDGARSCVVLVGYGRHFRNDALFTYPGNHRVGVQVSQRVHGEAPTSPGAVVGLPEGSTTGPAIIVWTSGPWEYTGRLTLTSASLTGPRGPIAFRGVDPVAHPQIGYYLRPGVFFLVPVGPLPARSTIHASVTVSGGGRKLTKHWSFSTG